jgi:hypothetical protein
MAAAKLRPPSTLGTEMEFQTPNMKTKTKILHVIFCFYSSRSKMISRLTVCLPAFVVCRKLRPCPALGIAANVAS